MCGETVEPWLPIVDWKKVVNDYHHQKLFREEVSMQPMHWTRKVLRSLSAKIAIIAVVVGLVAP
jgi:hypothetical protein